MPVRGALSACGILSLSLLLVGAQQDLSGDTARSLWAAARTGDLATVEALLQSGLDIDVATEYGSTALAFAADQGHLEIVQLLLQRGAEVDSRDTFYEMTPLIRALGVDMSTCNDTRGSRAALASHLQRR